MHYILDNIVTSKIDEHIVEGKVVELLLTPNAFDVAAIASIIDRHNLKYRMEENKLNDESLYVAALEKELVEIYGHKTDIAQLLSELISDVRDTEIVKDLVEGLGVDTLDDKGEMRRFDDVIQDLQKVWCEI